MFKKMTKQRLLELAGIEPIKHGPTPAHGEDDSDAGLHGEQPIGGTDDSGDEGTEEHLDKETSVFSKVHDALEELLDFLHSQENFEEKRGKENEYAEMEHDAEDLKNTMKKHLSGYEGDEGSEEGDEDHEGGEEDIRMVKPEKNPMSFR